MDRRDAVLDDRLAVLGGRIANVLVEAPARIGVARRGACSGRVSPWRQPMRRRSRRCARRPRRQRGARPALPSRKPSTRQIAPSGRRPSSAAARRLEIRDVEAAGVDPADAARHNADTGGGAQHAAGRAPRASRRSSASSRAGRPSARRSLSDSALVVDQHGGGHQRPGQASRGPPRPRPRRGGRASGRMRTAAWCAEARRSPVRA